MSTVQTQNLEPVPSQTPMLESDPKLITPTWMRWFTNMRAKINVINSRIAELAGGNFSGSAGTYGSSTEIPEITVDANGFITTISQTPAAANSPLTTKGDIYTFSTVDARLPVGTDTYVLTASSGTATGLAWAPAGTPSLPVTTKGDILGFNTVAARIPVGTDGQVLTADSTSSLGVSYKSPNVGAYGVNTQTGNTYTLVMSDATKILNMTGTLGTQVGVPTNASVAFPIGTIIPVTSNNTRTHVYAITPGTTTIIGAESTCTNPIPAASGNLTKVATDTWYLSGTLKASQPYQSVVLADSPFAYWTFDSTLASQVGSYTWIYQSGTALTYTNPLITQGNSATFSAAYYSIPYNSAFAINTFSIELWINFSTTANLVIYECNGNSGFSVQISANKCSVVFGGATNLITSGVLVEGVPNHIVFSCSSGSQQVYVNGILNASFSFTLTTNLASQPIYLGSRAGTVAYVGILDELAHYNYKLSAAQVLAHYYAGSY